MKDLYTIDLEEGFSLERFRSILEEGELLPSRRILKEYIPERFAILESLGIRNLKDLIEVLNTKKRLESFAQKSGLPMDYLVQLKREANSYRPKPMNLGDIPGVDPKDISRLAAIGVKHTRHLFERARLKNDRAALAEQAGISDDTMLELIQMTDLARIIGVGPVFARIFMDAGINDLDKLAQSQAVPLFETLLAVNEEKGYSKIMASLKDVKFAIQMARDLPRAIEY